MAGGDRTDVDTANLYLSETRWRRDDQSERNESLNRRLTTLFALNFAVLAVLGASLRFGQVAVPDYVEYLVLATIFNLLINIGALLWAYRVGQGSSRRPDLQRLSEHVRAGYGSHVLTQWMGLEIRLAMRANERRMATKGRWITWAMRFSALAVLQVATVAALALLFAEATPS